MPNTQITITEDDGRVILQIEGVFDFGCRSEFHKACQNRPNGTRYTIDLRKTQRLDSSALGMLMILRDDSGGSASDILLLNPNHEIRKLLDVARFGEFFRIE